MLEYDVTVNVKLYRRFVFIYKCNMINQCQKENVYFKTEYKNSYEN